MLYGKQEYLLTSYKPVNINRILLSAKDLALVISYYFLIHPHILVILMG